MGPKAILGGYVQSQMHALKEAIDVLGNSLGFSWLWGHFEGLEFGVQGTTFGVCGGENRSSILERKQDVLFLILEAQN